MIAFFHIEKPEKKLGCQLGESDLLHPKKTKEYCTDDDGSDEILRLALLSQISKQICFALQERKNIKSKP